MSFYNWIDANDYTMECFLLFDRWALRWIFTDCGELDWFPGRGRDYRLAMAKALHRYPHVARFVRAKAPEFSYDTAEGGTVYNYRKRIVK